VAPALSGAPGLGGAAGLGSLVEVGAGLETGAGLSAGGSGSTDPDCFPAPGFCSFPGGGGELDLFSSAMLRRLKPLWLQLLAGR